MLGRLAALLLRLYQLTISRLYGDTCRYYPSCSEYGRQSLLRNGLLVGGLQTGWRLLRCNPWSRGGVDHVRTVGSGEGAGPIRRTLRARARSEALHG